MYVWNKGQYLIFFKQALQQIQVWRQFKISDIRLVISFQSNPTQKYSGPGQLLITMLRISGKLKRSTLCPCLWKIQSYPQTWKCNTHVLQTPKHDCCCEFNTAYGKKIKFAAARRGTACAQWLLFRYVLLYTILLPLCMLIYSHVSK